MPSSPKKTRNYENDPKARLLLVFVALFALLGGVISSELTRIHYLTHTDPDYHSICAVNEGIDCQEVARSTYAVFGKLPVSIWALIGYLFVAAVASWGHNRRRLSPTWGTGLLCCATIGALGASTILAWISATKIASICLFCASLYVVNLILLGLVSALHFRLRIHPFRSFAADALAAASRPWPAAALAALFVGAAAVLMGLVPSYWIDRGFEDLPSLPTGVTPDGHPWWGARNPVIVIEEFSDYQCPYCRKAHKSARLQVAARSGEVRLVHRHLPLDDACHPQIEKPFHDRACDFSKAAVCAGTQGRFWDMNDALFAMQDFVPARDLDTAKLAEELGLDLETFETCLNSDEPEPLIQGDIREAIRRKIIGTPTFFLGSQAFPGGIPDEALDARIEKVLEIRQKSSSDS